MLRAVVLPRRIQSVLRAVRVHACRSAGTRFSFEGCFKLDCLLVVFFPFVRSCFEKQGWAEQGRVSGVPRCHGSMHMCSLSLLQTAVVMTTASGTVVLVPN